MDIVTDIVARQELFFAEYLLLAIQAPTVGTCTHLLSNNHLACMKT